MDGTCLLEELKVAVVPLCVQFSLSFSPPPSYQTQAQAEDASSDGVVAEHAHSALPL